MLYSENAQNALIAWQQARGDALFPLAPQFGPVQMRKFLPYVALFRKLDDGDYLTTLVGTALAESFSFDPTGLSPLEIFQESERDEIRAMYELMFPNHLISHSQRAYERPSGVRVVVEQLLLPVGDADGRHDRYLYVADHVPVPVARSRQTSTPPVLGQLQLRTVYDPVNLLPVDSPINTPRPPEDMRIPLTDFLQAG